MNEKMYNDLKLFIDREIKRRRYHSLFEAGDIINDLFLAHPDYILEEYKKEVPKQLNKEESEERNFSNSPEKKFQNRKNSSAATANKIATDPAYKLLNNKNKNDWEKKERLTNPEFRKNRNEAQRLRTVKHNAVKNSKDEQTCLLDKGICVRKTIKEKYHQDNCCPFQDKYSLYNGKCTPLK